MLLNLVGGAVALYGAAVFLRRGFPDVLFLRTHFAFLDFAEPPLLFYLDYLALLGTFVFLGCSGTKFLRRNRKGGNFSMKKNIGNPLALYPTPLVVGGGDGGRQTQLAAAVGPCGHPRPRTM